MFKRLLPLVLVTFLALPGWSAPVILFDNLLPSGGSSEPVSLTTWQAQQFSTGSSGGMLEQVILNVSQSSPGATIVDIYSSVANEPGGTILGSLVSAGGYTSGLSSITYTGSLALAANSAYFVVLRATSGNYAWGFAGDNLVSGVGASIRWATSTNSGAAWSLGSGQPYQMRVTLQVADVPELNGVGAPLALSLITGMLLAASSRRRAV